MANLTRKEVIEKVGKGESISCTNLNNINLINADLSRADLEYAELTETDISGANIFHYKTHGWKIKRIECKYVYSCNFKNKDEREKSRRNFTVGEFEEIYKSIPTIDICFSDDFNSLDYLRLAEIKEKIRLEMPDIGRRLKKMERKGLDMIITLEVREENQLEDIFQDNED